MVCYHLCKKVQGNVYPCIFEYSDYVPMATKKLVTVVASEGETGGLTIKWEGLFIDFQGKAIHCMTFIQFEIFTICMCYVLLKKKVDKELSSSQPQGTEWI